MLKALCWRTLRRCKRASKPSGVSTDGDERLIDMAVNDWEASLLQVDNYIHPAPLQLELYLRDRPLVPCAIVMLCRLGRLKSPHKSLAIKCRYIGTAARDDISKIRNMALVAHIGESRHSRTASSELDQALQTRERPH